MYIRVGLKKIISAPVLSYEANKQGGPSDEGGTVQ